MAEELVNDFARAILILNLPSLEDLPTISSPIHSAVFRTQTRLLVTIFTPIFDNVSRTESWNAVQKILTYAYLQANIIVQQQNKVLMNIDVLLRSAQAPADEVLDDWDTIFNASGTDEIPIPLAWSSLPSIAIPKESPASIEERPTISHDLDDGPSGYPVVALGGTFDHLHAGHKILLSMSAWIAQEKIIVGVTDDSLLVRKAHKELLESISTRLESVRNFLQLFRPGLIYDIVPITDVYGPTSWDPNIQALVVSKETLTGADAVASLRAQKSLPALKTFVIDVISASSETLEAEDPDILKNAKMSSTFIRQWIHDQSTVRIHE